MTRKHEEGVALLSVLLLVAVMSALAVGVLDDIRFSIRRESNAEAVGQAQWYALGAETMVRQRLAQASLGGPANERLWDGRSLTFPVEGGIVRARLSDATLCFNLNSVVQGAAEQWRRRDLGLDQLAALMKELGIPQVEAQSLAEALADWIDTDSVRNTQGAEDDAYANAPRPYRTSGALLAEVSELRAIRGFTPEVYARIRPYVCALPIADLSPININMLGPDRPELLVMLMRGELDKESARRVILERPENGWQSVDEFWKHPSLQEHLPPDAVLDQVSVRSRFFNLEAEVSYGPSDIFMSSLLEQTAMGSSKLAARRWTIDE